MRRDGMDADMQYVTLGKTGLQVSVAGLGCGGNSRLGIGAGKTEAECISLVREALDLGVNFLDTAAVYGTETIVGKAIKTVSRDRVVVATKSLIHQRDTRFSPAYVVASLDHSLRQLDTDYIDVFQLHGVMPDLYDYALHDIAPALQREQAKGKFRYLGITDSPPHDFESILMQRAAQDEAWDVFMLAFNMMHQVARTKVFPQTIANHIGTLLMFVVRNIFSQPHSSRRSSSSWPPGRCRLAGVERSTLDFLIHELGASSLTDAAYRFARHEPGVHVVLFGTGSSAHLRDNIASLLKPPLPETDRQQLAELFGHLRGTGLDLPDFYKDKA